MTPLISESRKRMLKLILRDPKISELLLIDKQIPGRIVINDDGSTTFYKNKCKILGWIFDEPTKSFTFRDLMFELLRAYSKSSKEESGFFNVLSESIIENSVKALEYDRIIDAFVLHAFLGVEEGEYRLKNLALKKEKPNQPAPNNNKQGGGQQQKTQHKPQPQQGDKIVAKGGIYADIGGSVIRVADVHIEERL